MKSGLKIIGLEFLYLLICAAAAAAGAAIQTIGKTSTGANTSFMYVTSGYKYNFLFYLFGLLIFAGAVVLTYNYGFKNTFSQLKEQNVGIKIAYVVIAVIGALISTALIALAMFPIIGITGLMKPESLSFITYYIWSVLILLFTLIIGFKAKKQDNTNSK